MSPNPPTGNVDRRPLYLTFDDGPDPHTTPRVLEALARRGARATFFVLGERVRRWPATVRDAIDDGHRVELHGDRHLDHRIISAASLAEDTERGLAALRDVGVLPTWWRLPWGRPGAATPGAAERYRLRVVGWDADTHDWRGDRWTAQPRKLRHAAGRGGVVLLHDANGPGATRPDIDNTIELIDALVDQAEANGIAVEVLPHVGAESADGIA